MKPTNADDSRIDDKMRLFRGSLFDSWIGICKDMVRVVESEIDIFRGINKVGINGGYKFYGLSIYKTFYKKILHWIIFLVLIFDSAIFESYPLSQIA